MTQEQMTDTKIIGRINRIWAGDIGSDSSPIFETDKHEFNADGLKRHLLELATGDTDGDAFTYELYIEDGLRECSLKELFRAVYPDTFIQ